MREKRKMFQNVTEDIVSRFTDIGCVDSLVLENI
jgi:hypothetical protein